MRFRFSPINAIIIIITYFAASIGTVQADAPKPNPEIDQFLYGVTEMFFDLLPNQDFKAEYQFGSRLFYADHSLEDWQKMRREIIEIVGETPRYQAYAASYYPRDDFLYAAIDFSGQVSDDRHICGFVVWAFPDENTVGFVRLEQNIVDVPMIANMTPDEAEILLTTFNCPDTLISQILELSN